MIEIVISGRGGQGSVLASQILASAFFDKGNFVQAFPSFGAERRGAPVSAFLRVDSKEITLRCGIINPQWIILFDHNLMNNFLTTDDTQSKRSFLVNCTDPNKIIGSHFQEELFSDSQNIKKTHQSHRKNRDQIQKAPHPETNSVKIPAHGIDAVRRRYSHYLAAYSLIWNL